MRPFFWRDIFLLIFNGEIFGFSLAWFELSILGWAGYHTILEGKALAMSDWNLWLQVLCFLVVKDFIEYWVKGKYIPYDHKADKNALSLRWGNNIKVPLFKIDNKFLPKYLIENKDKYTKWFD